MALYGRPMKLPDEPIVHAVVAEHARRHADRIAVTCGSDEQLTYGQLDARANQFARYLQLAGVTRQSLIGVCIDRTPDLLVAILGILKAGAAYVPLDPTYPAERLRLMIAQLPQLSLVAVTPATRELVPDADCLDMTALAPRIDAQPATAPVTRTVGTDLCYVVFTSGSTGAPKAVAIDHRGWYNLLYWLQTEYRLGCTSSGLVLSSFGFDITQRALMLPLFNGACVHLLPGRHFDLRLAHRLLGSLRPATTHCAPSTLYLLVERELAQPGTLSALSTLTYAFIGGEPLVAGRIAGWATRPDNRCAVVNVYGVAECTDISSAHRLADYDAYLTGPLPAGRPIFNTQIKLLGPDLTGVPEGGTGEICVTGTGVGPGYLNADPADAQRFTKIDQDGTAVRLYRTGDRGYVDAHRELVLVGRVDAQVKVRGLRIDLGDIEAAIRRHPRVRDAAVLAMPDTTGETALVAAVLPADGPIEPRGLRRDLLQVLPKSMVPQELVEVAEFPLNPNGKIDRPALSDRLRSVGQRPDGG
jgi:D-alanine--poly(phosphoribitol) ligase subunit 1